MTSDQLKYFLVVEKCLNYSEAAEELNISQSSLSRHIQSLEEDVGVQLFNRTTRRISLTDAGLDFSIYAKQILVLYNKLYASMNQHSPTNKNRINLSSVPVMSIYRLPQMIAAFNEENPAITIDIIEDDTVIILQSLRDRKADLVFSNTNKLSPTEFKTFPLIDDEMVLIVNKNHKLANKNIINLREAANDNFLFLGVETSAYNTCVDECIKAGFEPNVLNTRQTSMQIETILDFVSKARGVSIINAKAAEYYWKPDIRIIRMEQKIETNMGFVLRNEPIPSGCTKLIEFAQIYYSNMGFGAQ